MSWRTNTLNEVTFSHPFIYINVILSRILMEMKKNVTFMLWKSRFNIALHLHFSFWLHSLLMSPASLDLKAKKNLNITSSLKVYLTLELSYLEKFTSRQVLKFRREKFIAYFLKHFLKILSFIQCDATLRIYWYVQSNIVLMWRNCDELEANSLYTIRYSRHKKNSRVWCGFV